VWILEGIRLGEDEEERGECDEQEVGKSSETSHGSQTPFGGRYVVICNHTVIPWNCVGCDIDIFEVRGEIYQVEDEAMTLFSESRK
jgi:hypothetical protein